MESFLGELFGALMEERMKNHLASQRKTDARATNSVSDQGNHMKYLREALQQLQINHSEIDLLRGIQHGSKLYSLEFGTFYFII